MPSITEQLEELKLEFLHDLPRRVAEIIELTGESMDSAPDVLKKLQLRTHNLVSAAGIYGFEHLSKKAREFDLFLTVLIDGQNTSGKPLPEQMWPFVKQFVGDLNKIQENITETAKPPIDPDMLRDDIVLDQQMILYVTDDDIGGRAICAVLMEFGHLIELSSPAEAMNKIVTLNPDFILLGISMEEIDGRELAKKLRKSMNGRDYIPIIFLTSHSDGATWVSCIAAGGDDVIQKPFDAQILLAKLFALKRLMHLQASN